MKILIIADDESFLRRLPDCEVDILVSVGDLPDEIILQATARCDPREILAIRGNHDSSSPFPAPIHDLHLKTFTVGGVRFGGFCGSWKFKPKGNYLFQQHEVEELLAGFPPVDVFIAHNSPRGIHDRDDEVHLGFVAFSNYIAAAKPKFFIHGHQHHNIETMVGCTRIIGVFGHRFIDLPNPLAQ